MVMRVRTNGFLDLVFGHLELLLQLVDEILQAVLVLLVLVDLQCF